MRAEPEPIEASGGRVEPRTLEILRELKARLRRRFGDRVVGLYLFGSRARGDHEPDSDADVAVVFRGRIERPFELKREVIEDTYDLLLEYDLYIQPWVFDEGGFEHPELSRNPHLVRAVQRDGVPI